MGNKTLFQEENVKISDEIDRQQHNLENQGKTAILIAINNKIAGIIAIADTLKENAKEAIDELLKMDLKVSMIVIIKLNVLDEEYPVSLVNDFVII